MDETNRDSITNRLSMRMNMDYTLQNETNKDIPNICDIYNTNFTFKKKDDYNKPSYFSNPCNTPAPVINKNSHTNNEPTDIRKTINYIDRDFNISDNSSNVNDKFNNRTNGNSDLLNNRMQTFSLLASNKGYPLHKNKILPDNKPEDTRQLPFN